MNRRLLLVLMVLIIFLHMGRFTAAASSVNMDHGVERELWLNIPACRLRYLENGHLVKEYPVAVGKPLSPTPEGEFAVTNKLVDPTWYPPDGREPVPPGPSNPLGQRWLGFAPGYGIHGTNAPASIGTAASLGCVRMHNQDIEELFAKIPVGTPVYITYETVEGRWQPERGQFVLNLYPDIYNRGVNTLEHLQQRLEELGLGGVWTEEELLFFLAQGRQQPLQLPQPLFSLTLNGKPVDLDILWVEGELLLPLRAIAEMLGFTVSWEPEKGPLLEGEPVEDGIIVQGRTYLAIPAFQEILGVKAEWQPEGQNLALYRITATYGDSFLTDAIIRKEGNYFVAADLLATYLDIPYRWEPEEGLVHLLGEEIPAIEWYGQIYLSLAYLEEMVNPYGWYLKWEEDGYRMRLCEPPDNSPGEGFPEGNSPW